MDAIQTSSRRALAALLLALLVGGCAVRNADNRLVLNWMDAELAPESCGARWAISPLGLPVGLVGLVVDAVLVHPPTVFDDAWGDTVDLLWSPRNESRFRRVLVFPLAVVGTPIVFLGDWLGRAALDIPPYADESDP